MFFTCFKRTSLSLISASVIAITLQASFAIAMEEEEPNNKKLSGIRCIFNDAQEDSSSFSFIPLDLLLQVDPELKLDQVCKKFYNINSEIINSVFQESSDILHNKRKDSLKGVKIDLHPYLFRMVCHELFSLYSINGTNSTSGFMKFKESIQQLPHCHQPLCHYFLTYIEPDDLQSLKCAKSLITSLLELRTILRHTWEVTHFEVDNFIQLTQEETKFTSLHQHLMALKLLVLSNDVEKCRVQETRYGQIYDVFANKSSHRLTQINSILKHILRHRFNFYDFQAQEFSHLVHPLWSLYTEASTEAPSTYESIASNNSNFLIQFLDCETPLSDWAAEHIVDLFKYETRLKPHLIESGLALEKFKSIASQVSRQKFPNLLTLLNFIYLSLEKTNFNQRRQLARAYFDYQYYEKAMQILEDDANNAGDSPMSTLILFDLVKVIINSEDSSRFPQAKECLQKIRAIMSKDREVQINQRLTISYEHHGGNGQKIDQQIVLPMYQVRILEGELEKKQKTLNMQTKK